MNVSSRSLKIVLTHFKFVINVGLIYLIKCHFVQFDGLVVVSHREVNVSQAGLEFSVVYVYSADYNPIVRLHRFALHLVRLILQNTVERQLWSYVRLHVNLDRTLRYQLNIS